jgi:hypothetical protein
MVSLKTNLLQLQNVFLELHPFLENKSNTPGLKVLNEFTNACSVTNEIAGLKRLQLGSGTWLIIPGFVEGSEPKRLLRAIMGKHADVIVEKEKNVPLYKPFGHRNYWHAHDYRDIDRLYREPDPQRAMVGALKIALRILDNSPKELGVICGPISTGKRSVEANLSVFNKTVFRKSQEMPIFNQLPFEPLFAKIHDNLKTTYQHLLVDSCTSAFFIDNFYQPIFEAAKVWKPFFIDGWKASVGSRMEHELFESQKVLPVYLPSDYHSN